MPNQLFRSTCNMQLGPESGSATYADILALIEMDQTVIDVALFIRALPRREQVFIQLRMRGYDNDEIASLLRVSPDTIAGLHQRLIAKATAFFNS